MRDVRTAVWLQSTLALVLLLNIAMNIGWVLDRHGLKDLGSFLHSGAAYREGLNPYAYYAWLNPPPISPEALNLNPPISVYIFAFISQFNTSIVGALFLSLSLLMFGAALLALFRAYPEKRNLLVLLTVLAMAGLWHMAWYLQIYGWLLALFVGSWLLMRNNRLVLAGVLIGIVIAVKPNFALLPVLLILAGHWRVALPAVAVAAGVSLIPLAIDGPTIYRQWLELTMTFQGLSWTSNASLMSMGARFHVPFAGEVLTALAVLAVGVWQWRARPSLLDSTAGAVMAVILFGPVSWAGYTLFLLPFLFSRRWTPALWAGVLLLDVPFSPVGAASAVGHSVLNVNLHVEDFLPDLHLPAPLDVVLPAVTGSVYVWAVLLQLGYLIVERLRASIPVPVPSPLPRSTHPAAGVAPRIVGPIPSTQSRAHAGTAAATSARAVNAPE